MIVLVQRASGIKPRDFQEGLVILGYTEKASCHQKGAMREEKECYKNLPSMITLAVVRLYPFNVRQLASRC